MYLLLLWIFFMGNPELPQTQSDRSFNHPDKENPEANRIVKLKNKAIPIAILDPVLEALSYFPELDEVNISFEFKEKISGAVMQAQPKIFSLFADGKEKRKYRVKITRELVFGDGEMLAIEEVPFDALVGWIGHELGHVMDYLNRSTADMMHFGARYLMSKQRVTEAELTADGYAIGCGMGHQILANKNFILDNDGFEEDYKDKIRNLYMSPQMVLTLHEALIKE
ncbi:hypothetical protein [Aquiflexum sp.]|uniref:hypothetical protein n=1 Tax=Aquiflexum sp. TaxID=1872584 RepID=UPI0035943A99